MVHSVAGVSAPYDENWRSYGRFCVFTSIYQYDSYFDRQISVWSYYFLLVSEEQNTHHTDIWIKKVQNFNKMVSSIAEVSAPYEENWRSCGCFGILTFIYQYDSYFSLQISVGSCYFLLVSECQNTYHADILIKKVQKFNKMVSSVARRAMYPTSGDALAESAMNHSPSWCRSIVLTRWLPRKAHSRVFDAIVPQEDPR